MIYKLVRQRVVQEVLHIEVDEEGASWLTKAMADHEEWEAWVYEHEGDMELQGEECATDMYGEPIGYSYPINCIEALPVLDQLAAIMPELDELGCVENIQASLDANPNSGPVSLTIRRRGDDLGRAPVNKGLPL